MKKKFKAALLVLLFYNFSLPSFAQQILKVRNSNEESFRAMTFDSINNQYRFYYFSSTFGSGSLIDTATTLYALSVDTNMQIIDTAQIIVPDLADQHFQEIEVDELWPGYFILRSGSYDKIGGAVTAGHYNHLSNYHLCEIRNDSLYMVKTLLPDSAYGAQYIGGFNYLGKPSFLIQWNYGHNGTEIYSDAIRYDVDSDSLFTFQSLINQEVLDSSYYFSGTYLTRPLCRPVKLPYGGWGVVIRYWNEQIILTFIAEVDSTFSHILGKHQIQTVTSFLKANCWYKEGKLYVYESDFNLDSPIFEPFIPTLYEYGLKEDSIINETHLIPENYVLQNQIIAGYTCGFYDDKFLLSYSKWQNEIVDYKEEVSLGVYTPELDLLSEIRLRDTINQNFQGGFTHLIEDPLDKERYVYYGIVEGGGYSEVENGLDLFWGRITANDIDLKEAPLKLQEKTLWLYPNPAVDGTFTLKNTSTPFKSYTIKVFDVSGKKVLQQEVNQAIQHFNTTLPRGEYIIQSSQGDHVKVLVP